MRGRATSSTSPFSSGRRATVRRFGVVLAQRLTGGAWNRWCPSREVRLLERLRRACGSQYTREDTIDSTPLPRILGCRLGPATSRCRPAETTPPANHGTAAATRRENSPAPVGGRARVHEARKHRRRHAERAGTGEFSPEPEDGGSRLSGGAEAWSQPHCWCLSSYSPLLRPGGGVGGQRAFSGSQKWLPGARHSRSAAYAARRYLRRTAVGRMATSRTQGRGCGCVGPQSFVLTKPCRGSGRGSDAL